MDEDDAVSAEDEDVKDYRKEHGLSAEWGKKKTASRNKISLQRLAEVYRGAGDTDIYPETEQQNTGAGSSTDPIVVAADAAAGSVGSSQEAEVWALQRQMYGFMHSNADFESAYLGVVRSDDSGWVPIDWDDDEILGAVREAD